MLPPRLPHAMNGVLGLGVAEAALTAWGTDRDIAVLPRLAHSKSGRHQP